MRKGVGVKQWDGTGRHGQLAGFELLLGAGGHAERLGPVLGELDLLGLTGRRDEDGTFA